MSNYHLLALVLAFGAVTLIFGETIITAPLAAYFSYHKDQRALGLPIYISEYDVARSNDQEQLNIMKQQFPLFYNSDAVAGITLWGYVVGKTWVDGSGLIYENGAQRPAMQWLMNYLGR